MNRLQTFKRKVTKQCNPIFKKQYMQYVYIFTVEWKKQYRHSHNKTYNKPTNTFLIQHYLLSPQKVTPSALTVLVLILFIQFSFIIIIFILCACTHEGIHFYPLSHLTGPQMVFNIFSYF